MKEITCIFCKIVSAKINSEERGCTRKQCPGSYLVHLSPRLGFVEIVGLYDHGDAHLALTAKNDITSKIQKDYTQNIPSILLINILSQVRYWKLGQKLDTCLMKQI